jgi:DHA2 family multidrug resistance protein-like MFS transporter
MQYIISQGLRESTRNLGKRGFMTAEMIVAAASGSHATTRRANWAIAALALGAFATIAATAMPLAALPTLGDELHASHGNTVWIIVLFQCGSAMTLLPAAALVEIYGARPILLAGLVLFTAASFACVACTGLTGLAVARSIQGIGSAGVMTVTGALVRQYYPPAHYGRGIGVASFASATAGALGPAIGAFLVSWANWQAIFIFSGVNGLIALATAWPALVPVPRADRSFPLGQSAAISAVIGASLVGLFGLTQSLTNPVYAALLGGGGIGIVLMVRRQLNTVNPVLPVDLLIIPELARPYLLSLGFFCAHLMTFILLPFLLISRNAVRPSDVGILICPLSLFSALSALPAARLSERYPARTVASMGTALLALGIFAIATTPADAGWLDIAWRSAITGVGVGLFQTPNFKLIIASAPANRSASASGLQATTRLVGQALGAAIVAFGLHLAGPASLVTLFLAGFIAAVLTILGLTGRRNERTTHRAALISVPVALEP